MTPKEKADELVNKYNYLLSTHIFNGTFDISKQCALIAVDEIINEEETDYWEAVKKEIELL